MTDHELNLTVTDDDGNEIEDPSLSINGYLIMENGAVVGTSGSGDGGGGDGGADATATYVTLSDESSSLENSQQHAALSAADLHDPKTHGSADHDGTVAELSDQGVLRSSQVPDLAITETYSVADESERLALDVQEGDVAIQEDNSETYIFTGGDPSNTANWSNVLFPEPPVDDVFGRTGSISAQSGDYSYAQIDGTHGDEAHGDINATTWGGYEVYVQNSAPSTSEPYIRLEDE